MGNENTEHTAWKSLFRRLAVKRKIKRDFGCNRKFTGNECGEQKSWGIFPSASERRRNSKGTGWPYLETVWKDRIDEPGINYHTSFHAWLESSVAGKVDRDALESLMKADSISSISSPDRSVMVVSVLRIYDICRKWRCTGVNRLKADQSFRVDEMKVQTRSPCERTVDEKRERKKRKRIDLIRRSLLP